MKTISTLSFMAVLAWSTACVVAEQPDEPASSPRAGACQPSDCGAPLGRFTCENGSQGGPQECVELQEGTCAWSVAACDGDSERPLYFSAYPDSDEGVELSTFASESSTSARYCGPRNCWAVCATCLFRDCIDSGFPYSFCADLRESCKDECPKLEECPYSDPFCDFDFR